MFISVLINCLTLMLHCITVQLTERGGDLSLHFPGMVEKKMAVFFVFWVFFVVVYIKEVFREVFYQGGAVQCWNVLDCSQG